MHTSAKLLGYMGLTPFIAIPLLIMANQLFYFEGFEFFVQYSAIILSFFGGIHWLDALQNRRKDHQLYMAMIPSIVAWLSLLTLSGDTLLSVLSITYIGVLMYDKYVLALERDILIPYTQLRMILTTIVVGTHLFMAYL